MILLLILFILTELVRYHSGIWTYGDIPSTEMNALYDLYMSTNGENWLWKEHKNVAFDRHNTIWNFTGTHNPCEERWQGLLCNCGNDSVLVNLLLRRNITSLNESSSNCTIIAIDLTAFNMSGYLPVSIGDLPSLRYVRMAINSLKGLIPSSIAALHNLEVLNLEFNNFTGHVLPELSELNGLISLDLSR